MVNLIGSLIVVVGGVILAGIDTLIFNKVIPKQLTPLRFPSLDQLQSFPKKLSQLRLPLLVKLRSTIRGLSKKIQFDKTESVIENVLNPSVDNSPPACRISKSRDITTTVDKRIIAIGDVHGSLDGLLEDLFHANVTTTAKTCEWKPQSQDGTLVVQVGDIVDRGPQALEAYQCIKHLQETASGYNGEVVRLLGNHELWWLTGVFYKRNAKTDTRENVMAIVRMLVDDIMTGLVVGAYVHRISDVPVMFVHAGFSPAYYNHLQSTSTTRKDDKPLLSSPNPTPEELALYVNGVLNETTVGCEHFPCYKTYTDEVFGAGPDRGGTGVGGPLWTDFSILQQADELGTGPQDFVQVVGHSMAWCYSPQTPDQHPPMEAYECSHGLVRPSRNLRSVCVDGGMYLGARAFLEIEGSSGHFVSHQRFGDETTPWVVRDLTEEACNASE